MRSHKVCIAALTLLFLFLAVPRLYFFDLEHGDDYQDADVLNAGRNFLILGFRECRFLPVLNAGQETAENAYTHFPPLPMIINGLLRLVFGTDSLFFFRCGALFFSLLHLLAWYAFIFMLFGDRRAALVSSLLYLTNPFFLFGFDSVSSINLADGFRVFMLLCFVSAARQKGVWRRRAVILLWLVSVLAALISFEYIVYMVLFYALYRFWLRPGEKFPTLGVFLFLTSAPVAGFLLHLAQNAWYFGSFAEAVGDLSSSALERMGGVKEIPLAHRSFTGWFSQVIVKNVNLTVLPGGFLLLLSGFSAYLGYQAVPPEKRGAAQEMFRLFVVLLACGMTWYVLFPAHSLAHAFIFLFTRHLVPAGALFLTLVFMILLFVIEGRQRLRVLKKIAWGMSLCAACAWGVLRSQVPVTKEKILHSDDFRSFKQCLGVLRAGSREKDTVGLNYHRMPFISYYTQRRCLRIFDGASLEAQDTIPRYFIWFPHRERGAMALLEELQRYYDKMYECRSVRFPSVFFERREQ